MYYSLYKVCEGLISTLLAASTLRDGFIIHQTSEHHQQGFIATQLKMKKSVIKCFALALTNISDIWMLFSRISFPCSSLKAVGCEAYDEYPMNIQRLNLEPSKVQPCVGDPTQILLTGN